jgi:uncharacterized protein with PIN domain
VETKFIVDNNVGKLAKWLRVMGYDAVLFSGEDDVRMVKVALAQGRVILTKDREVMKRRLVTSGKLKAVLIEGDDVEAQLHQVVEAFNLDYHFSPFSVCLECNQHLIEKDKDAVQKLVPPYVFKTQRLYMECPSCHRIYWRGTHWQAMNRELEKLAGEQ